MHLIAGRARAAALYPAKFCRALCKGMKRQARVDASGMLSTLIHEGGWDEVGDVTHVPELWKKCLDDISGKELKPELVRAAREEELKVVDERWDLVISANLRVRWGDGQEARQGKVGRCQQGRRRVAQREMSYCCQGHQRRQATLRPHRHWNI